jgi:hypothetical protein
MGYYNGSYEINRKTFRKNQLEAVKEQESVHTLGQVIGSMKKVVLYCKMGDNKFKNKTITGNHQLENIINGMVDGSVTKVFAKWFGGYDSHKGNFIKMSLLFRPFLPKMTQKIMGEVYQFAQNYLPQFDRYKSFQQRSHIDSKFREENVYYSKDGEQDSERLKPLSRYAYMDFFEKVFKKRYPDLWYVVKPHVPIGGKATMSIGQGGGTQVFVSIRDKRIVIDMSHIIATLTEKINAYEENESPIKNKYILLREKARRVDDDNY